jgi:hypothetical protein
MDQNPQNYFSIQEVLADVQVILNDEDNKQLTPGFYNAQVKYSLDELGFDVSFLPVVTDVELPDDLIVDMPIGCFNLNYIHLFTGTPDNILAVENVYWKKGAQTRGKDTGMTADVKGWNRTDPFFRVHLNEGSIYYFSVQTGLIRLSDACAGFDFVRLTYDGIPSKNLDVVKMVPPECRKAISEWVTVRCAGALMMRDARYRIVKLDAERSLDEYGMMGSWHEAKQRLLKLDKKKLRDVILYNAKLNF